MTQRSRSTAQRKRELCTMRETTKPVGPLGMQMGPRQTKKNAHEKRRRKWYHEPCLTHHRVKGTWSV